MQCPSIFGFISLTNTWTQVLMKSWIPFINSDGAAALVLVSGEKVLKLGLQVIAKISGYADAAQVL